MKPYTIVAQMSPDLQFDTEEEAVAQHASVPLKVKHAELKPDRMNLWQSLKHEFHRAWFT